MKSWLRYLGVGLVLALVCEAELKLVAGINPRAFGIVLLAYPVILTAAYGASALTNRVIASRWRADLTFYIASGIAGLAIEWGLLGNGPQSNAFQLGMFGMWTTFLFGARLLSRESVELTRRRTRFWTIFAVASIGITGAILLITDYDARVVVAVYLLSGAYIAWSAWLLLIAWQTRPKNASGNDSPAGRFNGTVAR